MKTKLTFIIVTVLLLSAFATHALWANKALTTTTFEITDKKIPSAFNGFCIAHISDLHNACFGNGNEKLLNEIKKISPDIIAVTGDSVDSRRTDIKITVDFLKDALEIAPVYFITGNHESRIDLYESLISQIKQLGVTVLENQSLSLTKEKSTLTLCGIADPAFSADYLFDDEAYVIEKALENFKKSDNFTILLSHRPEYFDIYVKHGFDLVLSGHAHGGQFRLPFAGGVIAPGQGFFPDYDSGLYEKENTKMIVSRGLGNSIIPLRLFNRPEIISITVKST